MPAPAEKLISRFYFDKYVKSAASITLSVISEALKTKEFSTHVTQKWHRDLLGYQLIARYDPATLGKLASLFESGETELAIGHAVNALKRMRAADPTLFWPSKLNQARCRAWMRRAFSNDPDSVSAQIDRADDAERFSLVHESARRLAAEGKDVEAIRAEINAKCPLEGTTEFYQRALAQTKGGIIQGAGPQNLNNGGAA